MKILLDIDGVMVNAIPHKIPEFLDDGFYKFNTNAVGVLNMLLEEGDEIILTTTHRFKYSLEQWYEIFNKRGVKANLIGVVNNKIFEPRKNIILNWIENNPNEDFLIIDDDKTLNGLSPQIKENLILTDPYFGLDF